MLSIQVNDPFDVVRDPQMPSLALALDPTEVQREFGSRRLPRLAGEDGFIQPKAVRVTRYKRERRCVIEYDVLVERPQTPIEEVTLIGKVRANRFGKSGYHLLSAIWDAGFHVDSTDGISVSEPLGTISKFRMWLQRKVPGRVATDLLTEPSAKVLGRRIAETVHKLHCAGIATERRHTMADELRILRECLSRVTGAEPSLAGRIARLLDKCKHAAADTPDPVVCGIHRDFYADQIIADGSRLYLIDFDLYCVGDPGLDIGNFIGHMTEQSLREHGDPRALASQEQALEERFLELAGQESRVSVLAYTTLTLVRHIYLSTLFADRQRFTEPLLQLCEQRLGIE